LNAEDERIQTLMGLGLTYCQAKGYLTLVLNGSCTAKTISRLSKVTRQDIYRIMPTLQKLGLAQKVLGIPIEWKATPIDKGLAILLERKNKQLSELHEKTTELLSSLRENNKRTERREDWSEFVIVPEGETHRHWMIKKLGEAQTSNDLFITRDMFEYMLRNESKQFKKLLDRGVKFRHIIYGIDEIKNEIELDPYLKENPNFQVRYISDTPIASTALFDNKEAIFNNPQENPLVGPKLWSNNPHFVALIQNYFDATWKTAHENINKEY
jgi:sugar-specific transcriptional regulator TrmB